MSSNDWTNTFPDIMETTSHETLQSLKTDDKEDCPICHRPFAEVHALVLDKEDASTSVTLATDSTPNPDTSSLAADEWCNHPVTLKKCGHTFGTSCISQWFHSLQTDDHMLLRLNCPYCRAVLRPSKAVPTAPRPPPAPERALHLDSVLARSERNFGTAVSAADQHVGGGGGRPVEIDFHRLDLISAEMRVSEHVAARRRCPQPAMRAFTSPGFDFVRPHFSTAIRSIWRGPGAGRVEIGDAIVGPYLRAGQHDLLVELVVETMFLVVKEVEHRSSLLRLAVMMDGDSSQRVMQRREMLREAIVADDSTWEDYRLYVKMVIGRMIISYREEGRIPW